MTPVRTAFEVNGREYVVGGGPVVVICIDGSAPGYHEQALQAGRMPWLATLLAGAGTSWPAHCAMPALTNPNNLSIATGRPPAVHGISGNTYYDVATGAEQPMTSPELLRCPTVFAAAQHAGLDVAVVTAKDKLRRLLATGLELPGAVCFSAEHANGTTLSGHGITAVPELIGRPAPEVYSADLSEFVLAAGVHLVREQRPNLTYLSLSDYVQHKHEPGSPAAEDFYAMIDRYAESLDALGATVVLTADHGMSAKSDAHGRAHVIYLEDEIARLLGGRRDVRVVLPITDPYVAHHGALGSIAYVHLPDDVDPAALAEALRTFDGIQTTYERADAARQLAMPADRIGDIVVLGDAATAMGKSVAAHDVRGLDAPLRSHGAFGELAIPFIVNRRLDRPALSLGLGASPRGGAGAALVHNYDAFYAATTLVERMHTPATATERSSA
ncbi:phosphonoacetate hydrolase [uncultured Jatrophihabitans sp.]|uniref:phosphonoacetate hydrolase n=1 Tax=uncultured Jatrophihabitans sp. TaxID=1610747 RepID=UPI0035C9E299